MAQRLTSRQPLFMIFFKARQLGISTLVNGFDYWNVWRLHDIEATLVTHEKPLSYSFVDRLRIFHDELPQIPALKRTLRQGGEKARVPRDEMFYNETRSKVTTVVAKKAEARGRSSPHYHLAEYAFYDAASELLGAIMPQLPPAGSAARLQCSLIVESTPNGKNDFYILWRRANAPGSEWSPQFYPWYVQEDEYSILAPSEWEPDDDMRDWARRLAYARRDIDGKSTITKHQLYWYATTLRDECGDDQDRMDREYPSDPETAFLLRSRGVFRDDMRYLQACTVDAVQQAPTAFKARGMLLDGPFARGRLRYDTPDNPFGMALPKLSDLRLRPEFYATPAGELCVWSPPQVGHDYIIGMDAAAGTYAGDYSVGEVLDVTEGRQVAELRYKRAPEEFTDDCVALGYWYNVALLYPEINSIGVVCMKRAKNVWLYPRVGLQEKWDEVGVKHNKYGMFTTDEQKMIMISFFKHVVEKQYLAIASDQLLSEMSTYVETASGGYEGDNGASDDCVMAMALALVVIRQSPRMLASMTGRTQAVDMNAATSMIYDAPPPIPAFKPGQNPTDKARVPPEVRAMLDAQTVLGVPANPIAGTGIDLPW